MPGSQFGQQQMPMNNSASNPFNGLNMGGSVNNNNAFNFMK
jgi:hypothetical protein